MRVLMQFHTDLYWRAIILGIVYVSFQVNLRKEINDFLFASKAVRPAW